MKTISLASVFLVCLSATARVSLDLDFTAQINSDMSNVFYLNDGRDMLNFGTYFQNKSEKSRREMQMTEHAQLRGRSNEVVMVWTTSPETGISNIITQIIDSDKDGKIDYVISSDSSQKDEERKRLMMRYEISKLGRVQKIGPYFGHGSVEDSVPTMVDKNTSSLEEIRKFQIIFDSMQIANRVYGKTTESNKIMAAINMVKAYNALLVSCTKETAREMYLATPSEREVSKVFFEYLKNKYSNINSGMEVSQYMEKVCAEVKRGNIKLPL